MHGLRIFLLGLLVFSLSACAPSESRTPETKSNIPAEIVLLKTEYLPNAVRLNEKVISGGLPEGEAGFSELQALGVKTVISVDGARPEVAAAKKYGLRYVHLPHGYDGIPETTAQELAKAVRDLEGPIYIHCHHGKHRSPAAAAVACIGAGMLPASDAQKVLAVAGTSESYRGLFEAAGEAHPFDKALLDAFPAKFLEVAKPPALAEAMVALEHTHDHLKTIEKAGWVSPANQPDLTPTHEALLLREHFTEMLRMKEVQEHPQKFIEQMQAGELAAQALEDALKQPHDAAAVSKLFAVVSSNCKDCHQNFRDRPLSEKLR